MVDHSGGLDACWPWLGTCQGTGYGEFVVVVSPRWRTTAHRAAWMFTNGPVPEGAQINHHCDVRLCCNPRHLYAGSHNENMRDMVDRKRTGVEKRRSLTPEQVRELRSAREGHRAMARRFGVSPDVVRLARSGRTYADVE